MDFGPAVSIEVNGLDVVKSFFQFAL